MAKIHLRWCQVCQASKRLDRDFPRNGVYFRHVCRDCWAGRQRDYRRTVGTLLQQARQAGL